MWVLEDNDDDDDLQTFVSVPQENCRNWVLGVGRWMNDRECMFYVLSFKIACFAFDKFIQSFFLPVLPPSSSSVLKIKSFMISSLLYFLGHWEIKMSLPVLYSCLLFRMKWATFSTVLFARVTFSIFTQVSFSVLQAQCVWAVYDIYDILYLYYLIYIHNYTWL